MSFRIDDILRESVAQKSNEKHIEQVSCFEKTNINNNKVFALPNTSILEQTLSNKNNYFCNYNTTDVYNAFNYYTDKLSNTTADPYMTSVSGSNILSHDPLWSSYINYPRMLSCSHYIKRKGGQVRFTPGQTEALEKRFNANKYLSPEDRRRLADLLRLSDRQVKTWFQNRRAKWRRCNPTNTNDLNITNTLKQNNVIVFHHDVIKTGSDKEKPVSFH